MEPIDSIDSRALGRVIKVSVATSEADLDEVLSMGFDRLSVERSTDQGITFFEVTLPADRPILLKGQTTYTWIDRAGAGGYLYRTRYLDSVRLANGATYADASGEPSDPIEGTGLATQTLLTVANLKQRYLWNLDLRNDKGEPIEDRVLQFFIMTATEWLEAELAIKLLPTSFADKYDYNFNDYQAYNFIQLDNYPLISVDEFNVQYPTGQTVVRFPAEWIRLDPEHGHLRIVPTAGTLSEILIGQGGSYLPAIYNGLASLPHLFEVRYTAGFPAGKVPSNLINLIGMYTACLILMPAGESVLGSGIANMSLSIDGLSQSLSTPLSAQAGAFGGRIAGYKDMIEKEVPRLRLVYGTGMTMQVA